MSASDPHSQKLVIRVPPRPVAGNASEHDEHSHPAFGSSGPTQALINSSGKRPASAEPALPVAGQKPDSTSGGHEESDFAMNKVIAQRNLDSTCSLIPHPGPDC
jgi:hypothetical protein